MTFVEKYSILWKIENQKRWHVKLRSWCCDDPWWWQHGLRQGDILQPCPDVIKQQAWQQEATPDLTTMAGIILFSHHQAFEEACLTSVEDNASDDVVSCILMDYSPKLHPLSNPLWIITKKRYCKLLLQEDKTLFVWQTLVCFGMTI